jgi:hypothetical protein
MKKVKSIITKIYVSMILSVLYGNLMNAIYEAIYMQVPYSV